MSNPSYVLIDRNAFAAEGTSLEEFADELVKVSDSRDPEHPERVLLQTVRTGTEGRIYAEVFVEDFNEHGHYAQVAPACFIPAAPGERTKADAIADGEIVTPHPIRHSCQYCDEIGVWHRHTPSGLEHRCDEHLGDWRDQTGGWAVPVRCDCYGVEER